MAQLHRHALPDTSKSPAPTVEQLLRGAEASKGSPSSSSSSDRSKHWDFLQDHSHRHKKSVLTKVKEKAKKLRQSLSKKKHDAPSLVQDEDDEDTEYLGAPMYESELAPEQYKEKARQHPRANAISDKHALPASVKSGVERDKEASLSPSKSKRISALAPGPSNTTPEYIVGHSSPSKSLGLSVDPPERASSSPSTTSRKVSSAMSYPKNPRAWTASKSFRDASVPPHASSAPTTPLASARNGYGDHIWGKGVSVKEYLMNKFEPGEDDRALSQVISEAISPKRAPEEKGVMEKFRDAVASLLRNEEPSQSPVTPTATEMPVSTNAYEVGQEESHGRILQAN